MAAFDTVKGSDYLADQDAVDIMCKDAVDIVLELEHMGLPFDRTPEGKISQRPFGGHTNNNTKQPVRRACHAADRTGHMILQTLYQQCIKNEVQFYDEYQFMDLLVTDGAFPALSLTRSTPVNCTSSTARRSCSPPAAGAGCGTSRPTPTR
ncbi:MAG: FAD-binding protein [Caldilineales bacterium]